MNISSITEGSGEIRFLHGDVTPSLGVLIQSYFAHTASNFKWPAEFPDLTALLINHLTRFFPAMSAEVRLRTAAKISEIAVVTHDPFTIHS